MLSSRFKCPQCHVIEQTLIMEQSFLETVLTKGGSSRSRASWWCHVARRQLTVSGNQPWPSTSCRAGETQPQGAGGGVISQCLVRVRCALSPDAVPMEPEMHSAGFLVWKRLRLPLTVCSLLSCPLPSSRMFTRQLSLRPDPKPPRSSGKLGTDQYAQYTSSKPGPTAIGGWRR